MDRPRATRPVWRKAVAPLLIVTIVLGAAGYWLGGKRENVYRVPIEQISIATVAEAPFDDFIAVRGVVTPLVVRYLTAGAGGTVQQVLVEDGSPVDAGQSIVVLNNPELQSQVATREADAASQINSVDNSRLQLQESRFRYERDLLSTDHELSRLKSQLERDKVLLDGNAIAPSVYRAEQEEYLYNLSLHAALVKSRDTQEKVRKEQLRQLEDLLARLNSNIALAKTSLDALTIRAPIAGELTALDAELGQSKSPGAIVGQVNSRDSFRLAVRIDEFYLGRVQTGQIAIVESGHSKVRAMVTKIYPQVANGTFKTDLDFTGAAPAGIHTGQALDLKIQLGAAGRALILPNGPFYQDTGGNWVFVVAANGAYATRRGIRLGRRNPQFVEVVDGLNPGERVVTSSYSAFMKATRLQLQGK